MTYQLTCPICGVLFEGERSTRLWCGNACRAEAGRRRRNEAILALMAAEQHAAATDDLATLRLLEAEARRLLGADDEPGDPTT